MAAGKAERDQHPDPAMAARYREAAAQYLRAIKVDPTRAAITERGLELVAQRR
jgi:hypothetical protein